MLRFLGIATATAVASRTWLTQVGLALLSMHNHVYVHVALGGQAWATKRVVCVRFIRCPNAMPSPYLAGKPLLYTEGCSMRRKKIPSEKIVHNILNIEHHANGPSGNLLTTTESQCMPAGSSAQRAENNSSTSKLALGHIIPAPTKITIPRAVFDVTSSATPLPRMPVVTARILLLVMLVTWARRLLITRAQQEMQQKQKRPESPPKTRKLQGIKTSANSSALQKHPHYIQVELNRPFTIGGTHAAVPKPYAKRTIDKLLRERGLQAEHGYAYTSGDCGFNSLSYLTGENALAIRRMAMHVRSSRPLV